jgi:two-component system, NtrC family, sensor kinase
MGRVSRNPFLTIAEGEYRPQCTNLRLDRQVAWEELVSLMEINWKVLLIDDDPGIRRVMALVLENSGYSVLTAADGESGVKLCQEESPHIVITDIGMPGIDGLEVLRRIKEIDPDKEVIISTAFSDIALAIKAMQFDAAGLLTKPISHESLSVALQRARDRLAKREDLRGYTALMEEKWMATADELAKTFSFQKLLIESSIDGIVACDEQGKVVVFNQSMEQMLGYPRARVLGKMTLGQFFSPSAMEKFQDLLAAEEYGGKNRLYPFECELLAEDGSTIPVLLSATVLFQEEQQMGLVVFFRNLARAGRPC